MTQPFRIELLGEHKRGHFSCGTEVLDTYFKTQVRQDIRRHITNCFVAVESDEDRVVGFYTIAAASILTQDLPQEVTKKLPRNPSLPAIRIGRLAVDRRFHGRGLGGALLADAAVRALESEAAAFVLLVDAKDEGAVAFYEHHGFQALQSLPRRLFLSLATAERALRTRRGSKIR